MTNRYMKDGKFGVLVSPGFGAGWSTWNDEVDPMHPEIIAAFLESREAGIAKAEEIYPDAYTGGLADCCVEWVEPGTQFYIHEYDGSESLRTPEDHNWRTA